MEPDADSPRLLDVIEITEPCQVPWESMTGDERTRFCGMCKKNVYNISEMSSSEAEEFLQQNLGSACLRFFLRADGTIVTDACPRILKPVRDCFRYLKRIVALALGTIISVSASLAQSANTSQCKTKQNADFDARRFQEKPSQWRMGSSSNVWRPETPRNPPFSWTELTTGRFALMPGSEVYMDSGRIYISEDLVLDTQKIEHLKITRIGACIDDCTASGAFQRGKDWVAKKSDRNAELYFKLALTLSNPPHLYSVFETPEIFSQYAALLRRTGRVQLADMLSRNGVEPKRVNMWEKSRDLLGIDPALLRARPKPGLTRVHQEKHTSGNLHKDSEAKQ